MEHERDRKVDTFGLGVDKHEDQKRGFALAEIDRKDPLNGNQGSIPLWKVRHSPDPLPPVDRLADCRLSQIQPAGEFHCADTNLPGGLIGLAVACRADNRRDIRCQMIKQWTSPSPHDLRFSFIAFILPWSALSIAEDTSSRAALSLILTPTEWIDIPYRIRPLQISRHLKGGFNGKDFCLQA